MKLLINELISYDKLSEYLLEIENRKRVAQIVYNDQNYGFFKEIETSPINDQIIHELVKHIREVEEGISNNGIRIPFELITEDNILKNEFYVDFTVYQAYNKVVLNRFNYEYTKDYYNRLKELSVLPIIN